LIGYEEREGYPTTWSPISPLSRGVISFDQKRSSGSNDQTGFRSESAGWGKALTSFGSGVLSFGCGWGKFCVVIRGCWGGEFFFVAYVFGDLYNGFRPMGVDLCEICGQPYPVVS